MSRITTRFGDALVTIGYDRPLGGYWGDIVPRDSEDDAPTHEFPPTYPFKLAATVHEIVALVKDAGYPLPATAVAAVLAGGDDPSYERWFSPDGKEL